MRTDPERGQEKRPLVFALFITQGLDDANPLCQLLYHIAPASVSVDWGGELVGGSVMDLRN